MFSGAPTFRWWLRTSLFVACTGGQEDKLQDSNNKDDNSVQWYKGKTEPFMHWNPVITSYDYDSPISEAGDYGQPGIGPPPNGAQADKFLVCFGSLHTLLNSCSSNLYSFGLVVFGFRVLNRVKMQPKVSSPGSASKNVSDIRLAHGLRD